MNKQLILSKIASLMIIGGAVAEAIFIPGLAVETVKTLPEEMDLKTEKASYVLDYALSDDNFNEIKKELKTTQDKIAEEDITFWGIITAFEEATSFENMEKRAIETQEYGEKIKEINRDIEDLTRNKEIATKGVLGGIGAILGGALLSKFSNNGKESDKDTPDMVN